MTLQDDTVASTGRPESYDFFASIARLLNLEVNVKKRDDKALAAAVDPDVWDETNWAQAERYGSWSLRQDLLRFLQLLCEGHRRENQDYLRVQTS